MQRKVVRRYCFQAAVFLLIAVIIWSVHLFNKYFTDVSKTLTVIENKVQDVSKQFSERESFSIHEDRGKIKLSVRGNLDQPNLLLEDPYFTQILPKILPTGFVPHGTYSLVTMGKPDHLHPFNVFSDVVDFYSLCVPSLAQPHKGRKDIFSPALAEKIEEIIPQDDPYSREYHVYLRKELYWAPIQISAFPKLAIASTFLDKHPVTAHDFKFKYETVMNPYLVETGAVVQRSYYADIASIKVIHDHLFIVRWKARDFINEEGQVVKKIPYYAQEITFGMKPLPRFVYQYFADGTKIVEDEEEGIYKSHSVWAQNFTHHWAQQYIVSCGPWLFHSFSDESIEFVRNPHYFDQKQALTARRTYYIKDNPESAFQDFKVGKIDKMYLPNNNTAMLKKFMESADYEEQVKRNERIKEITSVQPAYMYVAWNMHNKFFEETKVRQAMSLAIDKKGIIAGILNNAGVLISGPFPSNSYAYDQSVKNWSFDLQKANQLLEEAGWIDMDGDGIRDKIVNGKRVSFSFKMHYLGQSRTSKSIVENIATSLKKIGVLCEPYGVGRSQLKATTDDRGFDAILMGWRVDLFPLVGLSSPDPRWLWHSEGVNQKGSLNFVGFSHKEVDKLIERLLGTSNKNQRKHLYHRLHKIIFQEAPYTFLSQKTIPMVYREYIKNLFIPAEHHEWIPEATEDAVDDKLVWIQRE